MGNKLQSFFETVLYGSDGRQDERIRSGRDTAGNYSFIILMFFLWAAMTASLFMNNIGIAVSACALFLLGVFFYLFFLVRNGTYSINASTGKKRPLRRWRYAVMILAFALCQFVFRTHNLTDLTPSIRINTIVYSVTGGIVWTAAYILLTCLLKKITNRRLESQLRHNPHEIKDSYDSRS